MTIFIGKDFIIISGKNGDAVFNEYGISVSLHKGVNDVLLDKTLGCADLALQMIGA